MFTGDSGFRPTATDPLKAGGIRPWKRAALFGASRAVLVFRLLVDFERDYHICTKNKLKEAGCAFPQPRRETFHEALRFLKHFPRPPALSISVEEIALVAVVLASSNNQQHGQGITQSVQDSFSGRKKANPCLIGLRKPDFTRWPAKARR